MEENAKLLVTGGNVPVPELRMEDDPLFRPVSIQWLAGFKSLIGEGVFLLRLNESGIHVESGAIREVLLLKGSDEVGIDAFKGQKEVGQRRDHRLALLTGIVFVKGGKISEDGRGGRDRPVLQTPLRRG